MTVTRGGRPLSKHSADCGCAPKDVEKRTGADGRQEQQPSLQTGWSFECELYLFAHSYPLRSNCRPRSQRGR